MTTTENVIQLDPTLIMADENVRFSLKPAQIQRLAEDIEETGGVLTPTEVEELPDAERTDGYQYRMISGHYRMAAVKLLNETKNAGLSLPAFVREQGDATAKLKRQLSENVARENLSPMDMAVSIKRLLTAGVPRLEIRKIFSRPLGKKGVQYQPASNAWVNIVASFLDLPKSIQEKIHDGRIGIAAAYELTRVNPEKRAAVLERAEAVRLAEIEREEKDEEKYLDSQKKVEDAKAKADQTAAELAQAKADAEAAAKAVKEAQKALEIADTPPKGFLAMPKEQQRPFTEKVEEAKADLKLKQKAEKAAVAAVEKLSDQNKKVSQQAAEARKRLEAARQQKKAAKPASKKAVGVKDVQRAAEAEGASASPIKPMSASEMRGALTEIAIPQYPTVVKVIRVLECCFGVREALTERKLTQSLTPQQACRELAELLDPEKVPQKKGKK